VHLAKGTQEKNKPPNAVLAISSYSIDNLITRQTSGKQYNTVLIISGQKYDKHRVINVDESSRVVGVPTHRLIVTSLDHGCQYPDTYLGILRFYDTTAANRYVS
jgi:hypothetical protein